MEIISFNEAATANGRIEKFIENPDSNSGIVTTPMTIEAGEVVTIPAGRMAVLPNLKIDGELVVDGEVFIPSGATFSKVVALDGDQTIDDVKTFLKSPIVPTPTVGTQVANKSYVDSIALGVGQTWQDVKASRSTGVVYTNSTGKPIVVSVYGSTSTVSQQVDIVIHGVSIPASLSNASTKYLGFNFIVPKDATYLVSSVMYVATWFELR